MGDFENCSNIKIGSIKFLNLNVVVQTSKISIVLVCFEKKLYLFGIIWIGTRD